SPFLARARSAQRSQATLAAARRAGADSGHLSPPCFDSPRPKPRDLAPKLLRPSPNPFAPRTGRIGPCAARGHHCWPPSSAPPSSLTSRPFSVRLDAVVSFSIALSTLPTSFPLKSGVAAAGTPPCHRCCRAPPPAH